MDDLAASAKGPAPKMIVPLTQLRHFYRTLIELSRSVRAEIAASLARSERIVPFLEELFTDAVEHVGRVYKPSPDLRFTPLSGRKVLDAGRGTASMIAKYLQDRQGMGRPLVADDPRSTFRYLGREVSPLRTPGAAWANGLAAKACGTGGIDVLGATEEDDAHLVVGEIKAKNDSDLFVALVQSLTYCSELIGGSHSTRIATARSGCAASRSSRSMCAVTTSSSKTGSRSPCSSTNHRWPRRGQPR